jgi:hypothetical protein
MSGKAFAASSLQEAPTKHDMRQQYACNCTKRNMFAFVDKDESSQQTCARQESHFHHNRTCVSVSSDYDVFLVFDVDFLDDCAIFQNLPPYVHVKTFLRPVPAMTSVQTASKRTSK